MTALANIQADLKEAMRARDQKKVEALRAITSAIKQIEVDERIQVDDQRLLQILDKMVKQRKESLAIFKEANRADLVEKEQYELDIITVYLPAPLTDTELHAYIQEAIDANQAKTAADMGKVMAQLKPLMQGRVDMAMVSKLVKEKLSA